MPDGVRCILFGADAAAGAGTVTEVERAGCRDCCGAATVGRVDDVVCCGSAGRVDIRCAAVAARLICVEWR